MECKTKTNAHIHTWKQALQIAVFGRTTLIKSEKVCECRWKTLSRKEYKKNFADKESQIIFRQTRTFQSVDFLLQLLYRALSELSTSLSLNMKRVLFSLFFSTNSRSLMLPSFKANAVKKILWWQMLEGKFYWTRLAWKRYQQRPK